MKNIKFLPAVLISVMLVTGAKAQDKEPTGLPGDNFSLQGALEMFKKAANPEQFEKLLNTKSNGVNNLDLNADGKTDYIRVVNKKDGNTQIFILQSVVSENESQDVAVIQLEKTGNAQAVIQIVGDEDVYGMQTIYEPAENDATAFNNYAPAAHGPNAEVHAAAGLVVNVWFWPSVRYVFAPSYSVWVSPWHWYHYPTWWDPWAPLSWTYYRPIYYRYTPHYVVCHTYRVHRAPVIYQPVRVYSPAVRTRHEVAMRNYRTERNYTPRNTPGRSYNSRPDSRSATAEGRRNRTYDRNTPGARGTENNRNNNSTTRPGRDFNRNRAAVENPRSRDENRNRATAPRRDIDRTAPNVQNPGNRAEAPRRDMNRNTNPMESPRSREANRSNPNVNREVNRTPSETPRSRQMSRPPQQAENRSRDMNRARTPAPQVQRSNPGSARPQMQQAPRRQMSRETSERRRS